MGMVLQAFSLYTLWVDHVDLAKVQSDGRFCWEGIVCLMIMDGTEAS